MPPHPYWERERVVDSTFFNPESVATPLAIKIFTSLSERKRDEGVAGTDRGRGGREMEANTK